MSGIALACECLRLCSISYDGRQDDSQCNRPGCFTGHLEEGVMMLLRSRQRNVPVTV